MQDGFSKDKVTVRFVGGCVRKFLNGEKIDDIDVATILTTDQIKEKLSKTNIKILDTGVEHGTLTLLSENYKIEITTLRSDIKTDGRHAIVKYTDNWVLDSERRDFTINAIYLDINGKIFDPQMGSVDLKNKVVKFIGDPQKRIAEDYLRIIRFIRFKLIYDTQMEESTASAIKQNLDGIKKISKERILNELIKIINQENFSKINENNFLKKIFCLIFPEFLYLNRLKRLEKLYDISKLSKETLLALLLIDEKDNHEYFIHKYNVSKKIKNFILSIANNLREIKKNKNFLEKDLFKNIYIFGKDYLIALSLVSFSINSKIKFKEFSSTLKRILEFEIPKFHIDGDFLIKNGMKEGESIGKVLKKAEAEWIKNSFKNSDQEIRELIKVSSH